jgi:hypothetical protein
MRSAFKIIATHNRMVVREGDSKENLANARKSRQYSVHLWAPVNNIGYKYTVGVVGVGQFRLVLSCVGSFYAELNANELVQLTFTTPCALNSMLQGDLYLYLHNLLILKLFYDNKKYNNNLFRGYKR